MKLEIDLHTSRVVFMGGSDWGYNNNNINTNRDCIHLYFLFITTSLICIASHFFSKTVSGGLLNIGCNIRRVHSYEKKNRFYIKLLS